MIVDRSSDVVVANQASTVYMLALRRRMIIRFSGHTVARAAAVARDNDMEYRSVPYMHANGIEMRLVPSRASVM